MKKKLLFFYFLLISKLIISSDDLNITRIFTDNSIFNDQSFIPSGSRGTQFKVIGLNIFQKNGAIQNQNNDSIKGAGIIIVGGKKNIHRASITINDQEIGFDLMFPGEDATKPLNKVNLICLNDCLFFGKNTGTIIINNKIIKASGNIAIGNRNLVNTPDTITNINNIGIGNDVGRFLNGTSNIGLGKFTLSGLINKPFTGNRNIAMGDYSLSRLYGVLQNYDGGPRSNDYNIGLGYLSGLGITDGEGNICIGNQTCLHGDSTITEERLITTKNKFESANYNIAIGYQSMFLPLDKGKSQNIFSGDKNIAIGYRSGINIASGTSNAVFIGTEGPLSATEGFYAGNIDRSLEPCFNSTIFNAENLTFGTNKPKNYKILSFASPVICNSNEQLATIENIDNSIIKYQFDKNIGSYDPDAFFTNPNDDPVNELSKIKFKIIQEDITDPLILNPYQYHIDINDMVSNYTTPLRDPLTQFIPYILYDKNGNKKNFNYYKLIPVLLRGIQKAFTNIETISTAIGLGSSLNSNLTIQNLVVSNNSALGSSAVDINTISGSLTINENIDAAIRMNAGSSTGSVTIGNPNSITTINGPLIVKGTTDINISGSALTSIGNTNNSTNIKGNLDIQLGSNKYITVKNISYLDTGGQGSAPQYVLVLNNATVTTDTITTAQLVAKKVPVGLTNPFWTSSTRRYKENIKSIKEEESKEIFNINPVSFIMKRDEINPNKFGLIAEEIAENPILKKAVFFNEKGEPEGLDYITIFTAMLDQFIRYKKATDEKIIEYENRISLLESMRYYSEKMKEYEKRIYQLENIQYINNNN